MTGTDNRMNRYFIEFSFMGTRYHGWQRQPNATTVQLVLENSLTMLTGQQISTTGAGRTDTGVHARHFTAHFESDHDLFDQPGDFLYKINRVLPNDIAVKNLYRVKPEVHARFSAVSRTYEYIIRTIKDPFDTGFAWYFPRPLDVYAMNQATSKILEFTDFTSFSKLHADVKSNLCRIMSADWHIQEDQLIFRVQADRFLRNMVRALVGTFVEVGLGKTDILSFSRIMEARDRSKAGFSVPAHGLYLVDIAYPDDIRQV
jgi:tRNA pseudouridine38-40 synthase